MMLLLRRAKTTRRRPDTDTGMKGESFIPRARVGMINTAASHSKFMESAPFMESVPLRPCIGRHSKDDALCIL